MKAILFDTGPIINLTLNGLLPLLEEIKKKFQVKLIITSQVKYELYDKPMKIRKFELGAIKINELIKEGVLEMPSSISIDENTLAGKTNALTQEANSLFEADGQKISIVSEAEISCIALSKILESKGIDSLVVIDERTARMLGEKPENLADIMSQKLHKRVKIRNKMSSSFSAKFIRSSELVYLAYKNKLIDYEDKKTLEALLYATKFNGASISFDEIEILKKM